MARKGCFPYRGGWRIDRLGMARIFKSVKGEGFEGAIGRVCHRGVDARNSVRRRFHRGRGFAARQNEELAGIKPEAIARLESGKASGTLHEFRRSGEPHLIAVADK